MEVDSKFNELYFKEDIIKEGEKLPNKIKMSLEKCKNIDKIDNNIYLLINECIKVENNINEIKLINDNINKCNDSQNAEINFCTQKNEINDLIKNIKIFGSIEIYRKNDELIKFSSIIKDDIKSKKLIINWIEETINKKIDKFELIFKMSENGSESKILYKYSDNKGPTLTIIKTTKNKIFGWFTPLNWDSNDVTKKDESNQTFLFSLNLMKKYNMIKKGGNGIICSSEEGPRFGCDDFHLKSNMKKGRSYANEKYNFLSNKNL